MTIFQKDFFNYWYKLYIKISLLFYKKNIKYGLCLFIGEQEFVDEIKKAMDFLKLIDIEFYEQISKWNVTFTPQRKYSIAISGLNYYTINRSYLLWKEYGIALFLYYIYKRLIQTDNEALLSSANWMKSHNFPEELIKNRLEVIEKRNFK